MFASQKIVGRTPQNYENQIFSFHVCDFWDLSIFKHNSLILTDCNVYVVFTIPHWVKQSISQWWSLFCRELDHILELKQLLVHYTANDNKTVSHSKNTHLWNVLKYLTKQRYVFLCNIQIL